MNKEIISKRTENSKTYNLGGKKRFLNCSMGAIHYKDNYDDESEQWKDIDLTWNNNRIDKAPYILERKNKKINVTDKKTGETSSIELIDSTDESKLKIIPENTKVSFRHNIFKKDLPFEAKYKVTGKIPLKTRAFDDKGELELKTSFKNGILTEQLNEIKDKDKKEKRNVKGEIKIDPTLDLSIGENFNDVNRDRGNNGYFSNEPGALDAGRTDAYGEIRYHGIGIRFTDVTIPNGSTINNAYFTLTARQDESDTVIRTRIWAEDEDNPSNFEFDDASSFDTRVSNGTTAIVDWDNIQSWVEDQKYDCPDIKTVIQELINRSGWSSGNSVVLFWNDYDERSDLLAWVIRSGVSYNLDSTKSPEFHIEYEEPTISFEMYIKIDGVLVPISAMYTKRSGSLVELTNIQF